MSRYASNRIVLLLVCGLLITVFAFSPGAAQDNVHVVQRGENLYRIALHYGVSMDAIIQANNLTDPSHIFAGQQLVIPNFDPTPSTVDNPMVAGTPIYHTVVYGDTLQSIAQQYGMTPDQLMQINNITNPNLIYRGQQLTVWSTTGVEPDTTSADAPQINVSSALTSDTTATQPQADSTTYVVQPGEHLAEIARRYNVSWPAIAQANSLTDPNQIFAGQTLIIPAPGTVADLGILNAPAPSTTAITPYPPTIFVGKQVVVDLTHQMVYAYQDGVLVRSVLVSTGLPGTPTVLGDYNVYVKYTAQTMSGPGYYLPDVPYVMYFYEGYSLHGTYWHNNFGHPMSHGCVNMPTPEAEWFFNNFVEVGTPIHVQY